MTASKEDAPEGDVEGVARKALIAANAAANHALAANQEIGRVAGAIARLEDELHLAHSGTRRVVLANFPPAEVRRLRKP
jgi:hypothetical protein